ncbi:HIT family protein [Nocardiopsis flavescens]|uniref:HIT family protein n=1 Tax=Nocardiopsis flavescens TaxID=758803 RepID=UPI003668953A
MRHPTPARRVPEHPEERPDTGADTPPGGGPVSAPCPFCEVVAGRAPATVVHHWPDALAIRPRRPVADDHVLVIPRVHVVDAARDPGVTAAAMRRAAELLVPGAHVGVNTGAAAGQTVFHLHIHLWGCLGGTRCMPWGCPPPGPAPS